MIEVFIDFETYSIYNVKDVGPKKYATGSEILLLGIRIQNGPYQYVCGHDAVLKYLEAFILDPRVVFIAFNAEFERDIMNQFISIPVPPEKFICVQALAASLGLGASLDKVAKLLGFEGKISEGKNLIQKFCMPRKPTKKDPSTRHYMVDFPSEALQFLSYLEQDVELEKLIYDALSKWHFTPEQHQHFYTTCKLNEQGIPIDEEALGIFDQRVDEEKHNLRVRCEKITGGFRPTQTQKILDWCNSKIQDPYLRLINLRKETVSDLLTFENVRYLEIVSPEVLEVLTCRILGNLTSVSKIKKIIGCGIRVGGVNWVHDTLRHLGAITGRYAGSRVQQQNFKRPNYDLGKPEDVFNMLMMCGSKTIEAYCGAVLECLSSSMRKLIAAPPGKILLKGDYSNIESRLLAWTAGEDNILEAYRQGRDLYVELVSEILGIPESDISKDSKERMMGKQTSLGCQYRMGAKVLQVTCARYGVEISLELAQKLVYGFRQTRPKVKQSWYDIEEVAYEAVLTGRPQKKGHYEFYMDGSFLFCPLPSGRKICYPFPSIKKGRYNDCLHYYTNKGGGFLEVETHGGKLIENHTQAIGFDIMLHGIQKCEADNFTPILTVHDDLAALRDMNPEDQTDPIKTKNLMHDFSISLADKPWWLPRDFPLEVDCSIGRRYA